jgi:hypothetical protein
MAAMAAVPQPSRVQHRTLDVRNCFLGHGLYRVKQQSNFHTANAIAEVAVHAIVHVPFQWQALQASGRHPHVVSFNSVAQHSLLQLMFSFTFWVLQGFANKLPQRFRRMLLKQRHITLRNRAKLRILFSCALCAFCNAVDAKSTRLQSR